MSGAREAKVRAAGLAVAVAMACGCGGGSPLAGSSWICEPPCVAGTHCTADGCIAEHPLVDLAMGADSTEACAPPCSAAAPYCNPERTCVPCLVDDQCPLGMLCRAIGRATGCIPGCESDGRCGGGAMKCCAGTCIDTASDARNCGACGMACVEPNGAGACVNGACAAGACADGFADCNRNPGDGCEANLRIDPRNCAACGAACDLPNAHAACADGCYLAACRFGWADCNGDADDGCEVGTLADPKNCGGCGVTCGAIPHGRNGCINQLCQLTSCDAGFADCDRRLDDGCEVAIATDGSNCGGCGVRCAMGLVCKSGGCTCAQCNFANARSMCVNQVCALGACDPGWGDCNGDPKDGCETATDADPKSCGGCGQACPMMAPACNKGVCSQYYRSCLDVLSSGKSSGDGIYSIDPGSGPLKVYCDMSSDGGGWTLVHKNDLSGTGDRTDFGFNQAALLDPRVNGVAVLPRDVIAAISPATEFRVLGVNGYAIYSRGGMPYYTTDNHVQNAFVGGLLKYQWGDGYVNQMSPIMPFVQHATLVCPVVNGCTTPDTGHLAVQRFCCGQPNAGFWFNGQQRFAAGYYAGAGWVR